MRKNFKKGIGVILACALMLMAYPIQTKGASIQSSMSNATPIAIEGSVSGAIVEGGDSSNYYQIVLPESGTLNINFTSHMEYYGIRICDSTGEEVVTIGIASFKSRKWNEQLKFRNDEDDIHLEAGLYFMEVIGMYGSKGTYQFTTKFTGADATYPEPNNDLTTASNLELGKTVKGLIAFNDWYDMYKVDLKKSGRIEMKFTSYMPNYCLTVYDSAGKEIWNTNRRDWNESSKFRTDLDKFDLEKGVHYIKVSTSFEATGTYQFTTKFIDSKATKAEPNNDFTTAQIIKLNEKVIGQIALDDEYDLYKVNLTSAKKLMVNVTSYMEYYNLYIYDKDGKEVWGSYNNKWNENVKRITNKYEVTLGKGLYYIKVTSNWDATGVYHLRVASAINPKSVKLNKKSLTLKAGKTYQLKATIAPSNTDYKTLRWETSDWYIADVDDSGKVTARNKGKAIITVSTENNKRYRCTVWVK